MYWTQANMLLLTDVDEYSFTTAVNLAIVRNWKQSLAHHNVTDNLALLN